MYAGRINRVQLEDKLQDFKIFVITSGLIFAYFFAYIHNYQRFAKNVANLEVMLHYAKIM